MNTIKVIFLIVGLLHLVATVGCGVKGRPLPPEFPPQIGHGVAETAASYSQEEKLKPTEVEKNKSQAPDKVEVKPSTTTELMNEKKSSATPIKKPKKARNGLKDKSVNIMDDKSSANKMKATNTNPMPNNKEDPKK